MEMFSIGIFLLLLFVAAGIVIYFLPYFIAHFRDAEDKNGIFWLNLLLGWSGFFYFVAIIWAITNSSKKK